MKEVYLLKYSVCGIKNIEKPVTLDFYKKTISNHPDTTGYNIKGIYGMNGAGKSAIITSVKILKNLLLDSQYLSNPVAQQILSEIINKRSKKLNIVAEILFDIKPKTNIFKYEVCIEKSEFGTFHISKELFSIKKTTSASTDFENLYHIESGKIINLNCKDLYIKQLIYESTANLLDLKTMCITLREKIFQNNSNSIQEFLKNECVLYIILLCFCGNNLHVYLDQSDVHNDYVIDRALENQTNEEWEKLFNYSFQLDSRKINTLSYEKNYVGINKYDDFERTVSRLYDFLRIFKPDLRDIRIEKKVDKEVNICELITVYGDYEINTEFESTGVKKLIKLFTFFDVMMKGGIVFIDELDSNIHDVYLCAFLEFLMEYADGQLIFTTHNVGPMDILKKNKKSIDFLSADGNIYSWKKNGNYSPSKLYRNGMIEGSPFNVDSIDFINSFVDIEED